MTTKTAYDFAPELDTLLETDQLCQLIVWNDEVNTFDWVIETLMEVCQHSEEQAEQCAWIIHHKGKYAVKQGNFETLIPKRDAIVDRQINATIEVMA
jgi:ATP-dependent Clp protease adaptor protein ClpS